MTTQTAPGPNGALGDVRAVGAQPEFDIDQPWFIPVTALGNPPPPAPPQMDVRHVVAYGAALLQRLQVDPDLRFKYYNISRTWHKAYYATGSFGGEFGKQWIAFLTDKFPDLPPPTLTDFANIHTFVFHSLRRSMLALTGHDIDPDSVIGRSFHYVPNDGAPGNYSLADLGLSPTSP